MRILARALMRVAVPSAVGASPAMVGTGLAAVGAVLAMVGAGLAAVGPIDTASGQAAWTTYHRDPQRSGDDPEATQPITPVRAWQSNYLGAPIWSQPLV